MQPVNFQFSGEDYQLLPHTGFQAVNLYRKVNGAVGHIVAAYAPADGDAGRAGFAAMASAFEGYSEDEFRWLVETTLSHVSVVTPGRKQFSLSDMEKVGEYFAGRWADMYGLLFEVWNREKMLPFEMTPDTGTNGNGTEGTAT